MIIQSTIPIHLIAYPKSEKAERKVRGGWVTMGTVTQHIAISNHQAHTHSLTRRIHPPEQNPMLDRSLCIRDQIYLCSSHCYGRCSMQNFSIVKTTPLGIIECQIYQHGLEYTIIFVLHSNALQIAVLEHKYCNSISIS